jgi:hypothetical protein
MPQIFASREDFKTANSSTQRHREKPEITEYGCGLPEVSNPFSVNSALFSVPLC